MLLWPHEAKIEPKLLLFVFVFVQFFSASSKIASRETSILRTHLLAVAKKVR